MARRLWPNVSALGKRIRTGAAPGLISPDDRAHPWWTVVGVVGDVHQYSLAREPKTEVYFPMAQHPEFIQTFTLRASVSLASLVEPVRQAIHELDPEVPVFRFAAMKDLVAESLASPRLLVWLMCGFAALAMLLAVMGIYGVIAYMVSQRTHEIGVRMALGASRSVIVCMVLSQSGRLLVVGVGLGFLASYFSGAALRTQLFGVAPHDLVTTFAVAALLSVVALLASALPARRASRVDPGVALRAE
jgi:hypothetical protein